MQAFVEARYEYHWTPLVGCLVAHLEQIGASQPGYVVGTVTGVSYRPPADSELPNRLAAGLAALGVSAAVVDRADPGRLRQWLARRRIRRELRAGRPVTAYGVGVSPFGPTWGLIVGCDDERRAWRRDGPMTEQVSPWLPETDFSAFARLALVLAASVGAPDLDRISAAAASALAESMASAALDLLDRISLLDSAIEIAPQPYSHEVQTLAANWGEAAAFWREFPHPAFTPLAQQMAVALSRYATLFPYPMGGQPNNPGVRSAAVHILREAADALHAAR